jgi:cellulose synthase/poly-beta-1,6-N-acetylglucosamine synthase-like glycosyltransferase
MAHVQHNIFKRANPKALPLLRLDAPLLPRLQLTSELRHLPCSPPKTPRTPIGQLLMEMGALSHADLLRAVAMRQRQDARLGDILIAHGMIDDETLYAALAVQYTAQVAELSTYTPDVRLIDMLGADECLRRGVLPWRRVGSAVLIASCRPEQFEELRPQLTQVFGPVRLVLASETDLHAALLHSRQRRLAAAAETRVAAHESCRELDIKRLTKTLSVVGIAACAAAVAAPRLAFLILVCWAILLLVIASLYKIAAAFAQARVSQKSQSTFATQRLEHKLPIVSIMVPLFHEREIAGRLIKRLSRLTYPRELLDICLVVEEDDTITQKAIAQTDLPRWMRQIIVPTGGVKTKPRALNFALDFCRGSIIGIYDAEDAPEPDQIHKVAYHFDQAAPEVACLQGILDFYNAKTNWLARCFTVEYASWFRVILPGYEQLGLVVPLGGTTLFFRRNIIEKLGGWDAHNVTEDADLGVRLARHGYRTELIRTVTDEEANCRLWPWVKQRSRWLKGYAMTWALHMRSPRRLLQDLGWWKFIGVQVLFFGALSNALLAPLLWSFWILPLGFHHPLQDIVPKEAFIALWALFLSSEVITIAIGIVATSTPKHRGLWIWVPSLHFYYPLGTFAALKGLFEIVTRPYYWDKTAHGVHDISAEDDTEVAQPMLPTPQLYALPPTHDIGVQPGLAECQAAFSGRPTHIQPTHLNGKRQRPAPHTDPADFNAVDLPSAPQRRLSFGLDLPYNLKDISTEDLNVSHAHFETDHHFLAAYRSSLT